MRRCLAVFVLLWLNAGGVLLAQKRAGDPTQRYFRLICLVHLTGSGKAASYLALPMVNAQGRTGWTVPVNLNYNSQNWRQDSGTDWNLGEDVGYELQQFNRLQFLARCDKDHASERRTAGVSKRAVSPSAARMVSATAKSTPGRAHMLTGTEEMDWIKALELVSLYFIRPVYGELGVRVACEETLRGLARDALMGRLSGQGERFQLESWGDPAAARAVCVAPLQVAAGRSLGREALRSLHPLPARGVRRASVSDAMVMGTTRAGYPAPLSVGYAAVALS